MRSISLLMGTRTIPREKRPTESVTECASYINDQLCEHETEGELQEQRGCEAEPPGSERCTCVFRCVRETRQVPCDSLRDRCVSCLVHHILWSHDHSAMYTNWTGTAHAKDTKGLFCRHPVGVMDDSTNGGDLVLE